ncbi:MAG TPA: septal ring lytic transglycosylase RlpA family protein [Bacteroidia bacterium]|nr:septal ring lytic transglycosylase RlpA family protein [Bacteroidia bacterium]HRS59928.1 septal ring lytic transglycosylase RlpA family protein [Bacteroidia bacterium]HRU69310.1 septal ring lytic transglycosylase RlpA family protein [Bacteroidia bacterium]
MKVCHPYLITGLVLLFIQLNFNALSQQVEKGKASYYSDQFNGRKTASGEVFDNNKMTAAHRTHPFGTQLKVTNLKNNRSVVVTVNDRGPWKHDRVIDVTKAAAKELGFVAEGVTEVSVEVYQPSVPPAEPAENKVASLLFEVNLIPVSGSGFGVQVGAFQQIDNLFTELLRIEKKYGHKPMVHVAKVNGERYYRIIIGPYESREKAERKLEKYKKDGLDGFIIDLKDLE